MRMDRPKIREGSAVENLTCPSGTLFPPASEGELFRLKGHLTLPGGLYMFEDGNWQLLAKVEPMVEVGTTYELDVNTSAIVPIQWNKTYVLDSSAFSVEGSKVKIKASGSYELYYSLSLESVTRNKAKTIGIFVRLTTGYVFNRSRSYQFTSDSSLNDKSSASVKFTSPLYAGEEVELCGNRLGDDGSAFTISDNCTFGIRRIGK